MSISSGEKWSYFKNKNGNGAGEGRGGEGGGAMGHDIYSEMRITEIALYK